MIEIIIPAVAGAMVGFSFSGLSTKWKMIRLKSENIMLKERNTACSDENVVLVSKLELERHFKRKFRRDLLLWESLSHEIMKHPQPKDHPVMQKVPEKGIQLLNYYKNELK